MLPDDHLRHILVGVIACSVALFLINQFFSAATGKLKIGFG